MSLLYALVDVAYAVQNAEETIIQLAYGVAAIDVSLSSGIASPIDPVAACARTLCRRIAWTIRPPVESYRYADHGYN